MTSDPDIIRSVCRDVLGTSLIPDYLQYIFLELEADPTNRVLTLRAADWLVGSSGWEPALRLLETLLHERDVCAANAMLYAAVVRVDGFRAAEGLAPYTTALDALLEELGQDPHITLQGALLRTCLRANALLNSGERARARALFSLALRYDPRLARIAPWGLMPGTSTAPPPTDELARRLRDASTSPVPAIAAQLLARPAHLGPHRGRRVLFVMRQFFFAHGSREHELQQNFCVTAERAGLEVAFVPWDPIVCHAAYDAVAKQGALSELGKAVREFRPDLVIVDNLCSQGQDATVSAAQLGTALAEWRRAHGFRLVAFYPDVWDKSSRDGARYAALVADVLWHPFAGNTAHWTQEQHAKELCTLAPFNAEHFPECEKDLGATFIGSSAGVSYLRALWLLAIESYGVPVSVTLTTPIHGHGTTLEYADYARLLCKSRMTLQFSARNHEARIAGGRVSEALLARALLLDEANPDSPQCLIPYLHYIPFESMQDLIAALTYFETHPDERERVAAAGAAFIRKVYDPTRIWRAVCDTALG